MPLTTAQRTIFDDSARFRVVSAGRRFGKSFLSTWEIARIARYPDRNIFYIAPSYRQAKQIMWDHLKAELSKRNWVKRVNESDLTVTLVNNTKISLRSADNPDSMRGVSLDYAVLDEAAFMKKETWTEVIRPALSDRQGGALFITTPKGRNWIYDLWSNAKIHEGWNSHQFTTIDGGNVVDSEVEAARRELDDKTFRQEYLATFESYEGMIYYNWDPETHVVEKPVALKPNTLLHIGFDFNVSPLVAAIATVDDTGNIHFFDEIVMNGSNTYEMAEEIQRRYPSNRVWAYPDASGASRKTSSIQSDHNIMRQAGFTIKAGRTNPAVQDRIAAVNASLLSVSGDVRVTVDPSCKNIIHCISNQTYKEGTRIPDKTSNTDHMNDAVGYLINYVNPIRRPAPLAATDHGTFGLF